MARNGPPPRASDAAPTPGPSRAPVTPRACAAPDGEPLPLHNHIKRLLERDVAGVVNVFGPPGSGKTMALSHLAAVLPGDGSVAMIDADEDAPAAVLDVLRSDDARVVVLATPDRTLVPHVAAFRMAPWTRDDAIEYLLAKWPDRCASVMARLKEAAPEAAPEAALGGAAELWAVALDWMAGRDDAATPAEALRQFLAARLGDERLRRRVTVYCLHQVLQTSGPGSDPAGQLDKIGRGDPLLARLVRHPAVRVLLAAQRVVWDVAEGRAGSRLRRRLPGELLREVAALAAYRQPVMDELRWIVARVEHRRLQPTAASILHATNTGWRPEGCKPNLCRGQLEGVRWQAVDLSSGDLSAAHLAGADLQGANLDGATVASADLTGASLRSASLRKLLAMNAVLAGADLSFAAAAGADFTAAALQRADLRAADLSGAVLRAASLVAAVLRGANLRGAFLDAADLESADLSEADLRGATLTRVCLRRALLRGANFNDARLGECDLRSLNLPRAAFRGAAFSRCDLAHSVMPRADFRGAKLHSAGLAHVSWERADLRGADFAAASFHTGSSRSGLVGSVIASEGTRTGFYTDDYDDRSFKRPEEIRKANLHYADLREASVEGADFYLVDLRGARYTPHQAAHFRRCGAIL